VTPALIIAAISFTTLTRADYTLFVCALLVLNTTAKQVNFSTLNIAWNSFGKLGVAPPQRRNRVERKGANRRSTSAVYIYGGSAQRRRERRGMEWKSAVIFTGVPPRDDGSGKEGNLVRRKPNDASEASHYIRRLYLPFTLRRSNLTAGAPGSTFFSV
jgi:hypothetical protein